MSLLHLPPEILHNILRFVDAEDLPAILLVCRGLHAHVRGNSSLHRAIYLGVLDEPGTQLEWEQELRDLVKLYQICASNSANKTSELGFVYSTVNRILRHAASSDIRPSRSVTYPASRNISVLSGLFEDAHNRNAFLCRSLLFKRARGEISNFEDVVLNRDEQQMSAKLHCLFGTPILQYGRTRSSRMYPFACSKVYDLREYSRQSRWGPFLDDGSDRVDWEKVEAVLLVLKANICKKKLDTFPIFSNLWSGTPFGGSWPRSYIPWPLKLDAEDPYNVSGTWLRVVCFLDYSDFFEYNFPIGDQPAQNIPRPTLDTGEATRLILMKIHVNHIEAPGPDDGQELPVVHFKGFSRSLDGGWDENANSNLRGTCRLTPEGEVKWTTFSIFAGAERWRSEGIQLGGLRSARGVVGNWFDKDYDPNGPCGPTAFWKISDREPKSDDNQVLMDDFLPIVDGYEDELDMDDEDDEDYDEVELELDVDEGFGELGTIAEMGYPFWDD